MTSVVGIYTRVSQDPDGTNNSTDRQERLCRAWAEAHGWVVGEVFCDNDLSAFGPGVSRPGFERLLAEVAARRVDVVLCWRLDRLTRQPQEIERVWSVCERAKASIVSATEPVDTSTPVGLALVRLLITFASLESSVRSQRLRAKSRERAESGRAHDGATGFGHSAGYTVVVEAEAVLIREAAERLLGGENLNGIIADWKERGIVGVRGVPWTRSGLQNMLCAHRLVGDRSLRGVVVARDCFPPILDRLTGARVRHVLTATRGMRRRSGALLRGLVRCGRCGGTMSLAAARGQVRYACNTKGGIQCGRVSVIAQHVDDWVAEQVLWRLEKRWPRNGKLPRRLPEEIALERLASHHEALLRVNRSFYIDRSLTHAEYVATRDALLASAGVVTVDVAPPAGLPAGLNLRRIRAEWPALDIEQRRAVVQLELGHVTVHPAVVRNWFDGRRLEPKWLEHLPHIAPPPQAPPTRAPRGEWENWHGGTPVPRRTTRTGGLIDREEWISAAEAAVRGGVTYNQLTYARQTGRVQALKLSGRWRYRRSDIDGGYGRPRSATPPDDALGFVDAARYLGLSAHQLRYATKALKVGSIVAAGRRWYLVSELDAYVERCRMRTRSRAE